MKENEYYHFFGVIDGLLLAHESTPAFTLGEIFAFEHEKNPDTHPLISHLNYQMREFHKKKEFHFSLSLSERDPLEVFLTTHFSTLNKGKFVTRSLRHRFPDLTDLLIMDQDIYPIRRRLI